MNPYVLLGISHKATLDELKIAYRQAVIKYHPDSPNGSADPEKFHAIVQAYQHLKQQLERTTHFDTPLASDGSETIFSPLPLKKVDQVTNQISLSELIQTFETSENVHVRLVCAEAIALKRHPEAIQYLQHCFAHQELQVQLQIIDALGQKGYYQATSFLLPLSNHPNPNIALLAIRSLEIIHFSNRKRVIHKLREETTSFWDSMTTVFKNCFHWRHTKNTSPRIGELLMKENKISHEQLEVSLLLQKKYSILLGELLTQLKYVQSTDIQKVISFQKKNAS